MTNKLPVVNEHHIADLLSLNNNINININFALR